MGLHFDVIDTFSIRRVKLLQFIIFYTTVNKLVYTDSFTYSYYVHGRKLLTLNIPQPHLPTVKCTASSLYVNKLTYFNLRLRCIFNITLPKLYPLFNMHTHLNESSIRKQLTCLSFCTVRLKCFSQQ